MLTAYDPRSSITIVVDPKWDSPTGCAYVDLKTADDATRAVADLSHSGIHGKVAPIELVRPMADKTTRRSTSANLDQANIILESSSDIESCKQICEQFESMSLATKVKRLVKTKAVSDGGKADRGLQNGSLKQMKILPNPFDKLEKLGERVNASGNMLPMTPPEITRTQQDEEDTSSATTTSLTVPTDPSPEDKTGQKRTDESSSQSDKLEARIAGLEALIENQRAEIQVRNELLRLGETRFGLLERSFEDEKLCKKSLLERIQEKETQLTEMQKEIEVIKNRLQSAAQVNLDEIKARQADELARLAKECSRLQKQAVVLQTTIEQQKTELAEARGKSTKSQHDLIDTRQKLELARNEIRSHKKVAESTVANKSVVEELKAENASLRLTVQENSASVQQRRVVMLQAQIENLIAKHERELQNIDKTRQQIARAGYIDHQSLLFNKQ